MKSENWNRIVILWINALKISRKEIKWTEEILSENVLGKLLGIIKTNNEDSDAKSLEEVEIYLKEAFPSLRLGDIPPWDEKDVFVITTLLLLKCSIDMPLLVQSKATKLPDSVQRCLVHMLEAFVQCPPNKLTRAYLEKHIADLVATEDVLSPPKTPGVLQCRDNIIANIQDSPLAMWISPSCEFLSSPVTPRSTVPNSELRSSRGRKKKLRKLEIEIGYLNDIKTELEEELNSYKTKFEELRNQLTLKNKEIDHLKSEAKVRSRSASPKESPQRNVCPVRLEKLNKEKGALEEKVILLLAANADIAAQNEKALKKISLLERDNKELNSKLFDSIDAVESSKKSIEMLNSQIEMYKVLCEEQKEKIDHLQATPHETSCESPDVTTSLACELNEIELNNLRDELGRKVSQISELEDTISSLNEKFLNVNDGLMKITDEYATFKEVSKSELNNLKTQITEKNMELENHAEIIKHMTDEISGLLKKNAALNDHCDELNTLICNLRDETAEVKVTLEAEINDLTSKLNASEKRSEELSGINQRIRNELENTKLDFDCFKENSIKAQEESEVFINDLKVQFEDLRREKDGIVSGLNEDLRNINEKHEKLAQDYISLKEMSDSQLNNLKSQIAEKGDEIEAQTRTIQEKIKNIEELVEANALLTSHCNELNSKICDLTDEANVMKTIFKTEMSAMKGNLTSCRDEIDELTARKQSVEERLEKTVLDLQKCQEDLVEAREDAEQRITRLKTQLEELCDEKNNVISDLTQNISCVNGQLDKLKNDYMILKETSDSELSNLKLEIIQRDAQLTTAAETLQVKINENCDLVNKNELLTKNCNELDSHITELQSDADNMKTVFENEISGLKAKLIDAVEKSDELTVINQSFVEELESTKLNLENCKEELLKSQEESASIISNLKAEYERLCSDKDDAISALKENMCVVNEEKETLRNEYATFKEFSESEVAHLKSLISEGEERIEALSEKNDSLKELCDELDKKVIDVSNEAGETKTSLETQISVLREQLRVAKEEFDQVSSFKQNLLEELEKSQSVFEDCKGDLLKSQAVICNLEAQLEQLRQEKEEAVLKLSETLRNMNEERDKLRDEYKSLKESSDSEIVELKSLISERETKIDSLSGTLEHKLNHVAILVEKNSSLKELCDKLNKQICLISDEAAKTKESYETEIGVLNEKLKSAKEESEGIACVNRSLLEQLEKTKLDFDSCKEDLVKAREESEVVIMDLKDQLGLLLQEKEEIVLRLSENMRISNKEQETLRNEYKIFKEESDSELNKLRQQILEKEAEIESLSVILKDEANERVGLVEKNSLLQDKIEELNKQICSLSNEAAETKTAFDSRISFLNEKLRASKEEFEEVSSINKSLLEELEKSKLEFKRCEKDLIRSQEESKALIENLKEEYNQLSQEKEEIVLKLNEDLRIGNEQRDMLRSEFETLKEKSEVELIGLNLQVKEKEAEIECLSEKLQDKVNEVASLAERNSSLNKRCEELNEEICSLQDERAKNKSSFESEIKFLNEKLIATKQEFEEVSNINESLIEEIRVTKCDLENSRKDLMKAQEQSEGVISELKSQYEKLCQEKEGIVLELNEKLGIAVGEKNRLENEYKTLKEESELELINLKSQVREKEVEIESLSVKLQDQVNEFKGLVEKYSSLQELCNERDSRINVLESEIEEKEVNLKSLSEKVATATEKCDEFQLVNQSLNEHLAILKSDLDKAKEDLMKAQEESQVINDLKAQLESMCLEKDLTIKKLNGDLEMANQEQGKLRNEYETVKVLSDLEIKNLKLEISEKLGEIESLSGDLKDKSIEVKGLTQQIESLNAHCSELNSQISILNEEAMKKETSYEAHKNTLNEKLSVALEKCQEMNVANVSLVEQLEATKLDLVKSKEDLFKAQKESEVVVNELNRWEQKCLEKDSTISKLHEDLGVIDEERDKLTSEYARFKEEANFEINSLKSEISDKNAQLDQREETLNENLKKVTVLLEENSSLKECCDRLESHICTLQNEVTEVEKSCESQMKLLGEQLADRERKSQELNVMNQNLIESLEKMKLDLESSRKELSRVQQESEALTQEIKTNCTNLKSMCDEKDVSIQLLNDKFNGLTCEHEKTLNELKTLKENSELEVKCLNAKISELTCEIESQTETINLKSCEVKDLQNEISTLNIKFDAETNLLKEASALVESNLKTQIDILNENLTATEENAQQLNNGYEELKSLSDEKDCVIKTLNDKIRQINKDLEKKFSDHQVLKSCFEIEVNKLNSKIRQLTTESESHSLQLELKSKQNEKLLKENLSLQAKCDEADTKMRQLKNEQESVESSLKAELDALQKKLKAEEMNAEVINLKCEHLTAISLEKDLIIQKLKETAGNLEKTSNELYSLKENSETEIKNLQTKIKELSEEVENGSQNALLKSNEIEGLVKENSVLKFKCDELTAEIAQLKNTTADIASKHQGSIEMNNKLNAKITQLYTELETQAQNVQKLSSENNSLLSSNSDLSKEIVALRKANSSLTGENGVLRVSLDESKAKIAKFTSASYKAAIEDQIRDGYLEKLKQLKQNMKTAYSDKLDEISDLHEKRLIEEKEKNTKLTAEMKKMSNTIRDLSNKVALLQGNMTDTPSKRQSTSSLRYRVKSEDNISGYSNPGFDDNFRDNTSILVDNSRRSSIRNLPPGLGKVFPSADEVDEVFDQQCLSDLKAGHVNLPETVNDRLSILQKRNSMCLPHLKSSYPGETQFVLPGTLKEDEIKHGQPPDVGQRPRLKSKSPNLMPPPEPSTSKATPRRIRSLFRSQRKEK